MPLTEPTKLVLKSYGTPGAIAGVAPTLDYRFALDRNEIDAVTLTDKLTVTRAATAAVNGPTGYLQLAGPNVARFDHNLTTHQSFGLLVEEARTNSQTYSQGMTAWAAVGATVTSDSSVKAPDGVSASYKVQAIAGNTNHGIYLTITPQTGTSTWSVYLKYGNYNNIGLSSYEPGSGYERSSIAFDNLPANIQSLPNGWIRVTFSEVKPRSNGFGIYSFGIALRSPSSPWVWNATGNEFVHVWGAQVELGAFPTSYIPTTGSTVTRTESASIDGTGIITGTYTMVEKPAGCAVVNGTNIDLQTGYTAERVMVFPAALSDAQITAIRSAM